MGNPKENLQEFFWLAREREDMAAKRAAGEKWPWSRDYVLSNFRFCRVMREDDKVTTWLRENVREPLKGKDELMISTYVFRWFNSIRTGETLLPELLNPFDIETARKKLYEMEGPHFGSAYVIQSPTGMTKIDGVLWAIGNVTKRWQEGADLCRKSKSLEEVHRWLKQFPHMGPFMAYQVVCDLRYTHLLEDAEDKMTWTCAGPGAARGLSWLEHDEPEVFNYTGQKDQVIMMALMADVLDKSRDPLYWPADKPKWELSTVQHWACEYDKWRRGHAGQRLKRTFQG